MINPWTLLGWMLVFIASPFVLVIFLKFFLFLTKGVINVLLWKVKLNASDKCPACKGRVDNLEKSFYCNKCDKEYKKEEIKNE